jgi:lipopolysaccharide transport system permease protein
VAAAASLWRSRNLIWQLTLREVLGRYRGSLLGLAWSFLNPVLMLAVYTFVFAVVLNARWNPSGDETPVDFALILFVGMIVYGFVADCVNRAPTLVLASANYVKKVVFPLEILPLVALNAAVFHAVVSTLAWCVARVLTGGSLPLTSVFLPLVVAPLVLGTLGVAWTLASLGVYIRDIGQTIGLVTTVLMFLSPMFFPRAAIPAQFRVIVDLNPLTFFMEQAREVLVWGRPPSWPELGLQLAAAVVVAQAGFWWFQRTRRGFADVL